MGDTIFDDVDDPQDPNPSPGPTVTLSKDHFDQMQKQINQLSEKLDTATKALSDSQRRTATPPAAAPATPPAPGQLNADEALRQFAADPAGFSARVADGRISEAVAQQLAPILQPLMRTTHESIMQTERARFDAIAGAGKFDEIILPELQKDLDTLQETNQAALGDTGTMKALIHRIEGQKRHEINEAEKAVTEQREKHDADAAARVVSQLPPSMRPRPANGEATLDEDAKLFFSEIESATGQRPDEKSFLALQNAKPGLQGYLEAVKSVETSKESE